MMENENDPEFMTYDIYHESYVKRMGLRDTNLNAVVDDFMPPRKNAQIKVIQKFIGKLKVSEKNYETILTQIDALNLSKYLDEISSLIATSINEKEIPFYVQIATKLNVEYEGVPTVLIKDLVKHFNLAFESQEDTRSKLKAILLFTTELFVSGFAFSYKEIRQMVIKTFKSGKSKKLNFPSETQTKLFLYFYSSGAFSSFLLNFVEVFTRCTPRWIVKWRREDKELHKYPEALPGKMKDELTTFFTKYFNQCCILLDEIREIIKQYQEDLTESLRLQGQLSKDLQKKYMDTVGKYESTKANLKIIAECIGEVLDPQKIQVKIIQPNQFISNYIGNTQNQEIFEDEFQKEIYDDLPNLVKEENKASTEEDYNKFVKRLENCKNVKDSNEITSYFAEINNKKNRKALVRDVLEYRREYQLVTPYLCRVVAIVFKNFKDIGDFVNQILLPDFEKLKDVTTNTFVVNDKKSRLLKYICEFTKFKVIEAEKTMNCIQGLIDNLNGYNIQLIVSALENVGLFLKLSENSSNRFTFLLNKYENVIKKKSLPLFTTSQLINSINLLRPRKNIEKEPEAQLTQVQVKALKIMKMNPDKDAQQIINEIDYLMKIEGGQQAIQDRFIKQIEDYDFLGNYHYAYLLDELKYIDLSNVVIDKTVQNLKSNLMNGENQKTIVWSRFLGQLYNYKIIQKAMLYYILDDLMKITCNELGVINSICTTLDACVNYLDSKKISKKNERFNFFVRFKRYISKCKYIPMLEEFQIIDVFNEFEPDLTSINFDILDEFLKISDKKTVKANKEICLPIELDEYLCKKKIKKKQQKIQHKDFRQQKAEKKQEQVSNAHMLEIKQFDKELTNIIDTNIKDYSSRIAKSAFLEKNFEKKRQKKKNGPTITVIGRKGNKFIRKDIAQSI